MKKIIVLGGGISGLTTAYLIKTTAEKAGIQIEIKILEKDNRIGGKFESETVDGYLCEWGPNGFLTNKPQTLELCQSLGISNELLASNDNARKRFIYSNDKLHKLPHTPVEFLNNSLISWPGKLRIACEFFIPRRKESSDESLSDFTNRRLGKEALAKLIAPMASGVFAGNADTMSLKAAFPRIHQLEEEYGGLLRAMVCLIHKHHQAKKRGEVVASPAGPGGVLTSFAGGVETLTKRLQETFAPEEIQLGVKVNQLTFNGSQWEITANNDQYFADAVVSSLPAYALAEVSETIDTQLSALAAKISYAPLAVVCLGYDLNQIKYDCNGFGYLIARGESIPVLGTLWDSQIFAFRAPQNRILFRTMLGGAANPELVNLNDTELQKIVEDNLLKTMGIAIKPELVKIRRHHQAIPKYNIGHPQLISDIMDRASQHPGLFIGGNAFFGVGINDCVASGYRVSQQVIDWLKIQKDKEVNE